MSSILTTIRKTMLIPPHPAGRIFIVGGIAAALLLAILSPFLGAAGLLFPLFCVYFFRDPARVTPQQPYLVIAPADGMVSAIVSNVALPDEIGAGPDAAFTRVSIFLSVLDVHVNRAPVSGTILRKVYKPGKFFNADLDKASVDNERCSLLIDTGSRQIGVVQIAGLVARRILNDADEGTVLEAGARFGIIRFGSRVDTYLPAGVAPLVCVGQRAIGGETVLADLDSIALRARIGRRT